MTGKDLFRAIGNVSDEYITEAERYCKKAVPVLALRKAVATAACLICCFGVYAVVQQHGLGRKSVSQEVKMEGIVEESAIEMEMALTYSAPAAADTTPKEAGGAKQKNEVTSDKENSSENMSEYMSEKKDGSEEISEEILKTESASRTEEVNEKCSQDVQKPVGEADTIVRTENAMIVCHGAIESGKILWENFLAKVDAGEASQIQIVRYTVEGDPIIETIQYNGSGFLLMVDSSQDAFRGSSDPYYEAEFKYMQKIEHPADDSTAMEYVLTDSDADIAAVLAGEDEAKKQELEYYSILYLSE